MWTHLCCEPPAVTVSWRPPCTASSTTASWPCLPPSLDSTGCWRPRRWTLPKPAARARPALSRHCCTQGRWRMGEEWVWAWGGTWRALGSPWVGLVGWSEWEGALGRVEAHLTALEAAAHLQQERKMKINAEKIKDLLRLKEHNIKYKSQTTRSTPPSSTSRFVVHTSTEGF